MIVSDICRCELVTIQRNETVLAAAKLMRQNHVGAVIIVDKHDDCLIPIGIVTDRDLVMEVLATELDQKTVTVGDIMAPDLFTVKENTETFEAIQFMRSKTIRRLPIVNEAGALVNILTLDDVLELLSNEMLDLSKLVRYEKKKEIRHRP
jgi:predicted transcriptional regulator